MMTFNEMAEEFLTQKRIAVVGMSRKEGGGTANGIYRTLRDVGYEVFAINPHANELEGDPCYPAVSAVPGGVDGAIVVTSPDVTEKVVLDCARAGVPRIWMHDNTLLPGSVSDDAVTFCREKGIQVIAGGCPMMFLDTFHKCLKFVLGAMGRLPQAQA